MNQIDQLIAYLAPLLLITLKVGVVIGGFGSLLEAIGVWRGWPKLVAVGKKLEAIGTDIPKIIGKLKFPNPGAGVGMMAVLLLTLVLACGLPGCNVFGPGGSVWPKVAHCAPTPASLLQQATAILLAGGDYESALLDLAKSETKETVICAVEAAVAELGSKVGAAQSPAHARGKAFLARTGNET